MGKKRKRPIKDGPLSHNGITTFTRRFRTAPIPRTHPVISLYYQNVFSLRDYLLQQLPVTSKSRRRRILTLDSPHTQPSPLAHLLDSTLVAVSKGSCPIVNSERQREYLSFTQSQSRSLLVSTDTGPTCPQSEVVDFVIWKLFNQNGYNGYQKPQHLLAHGFQRPAMGQNALDTHIPGIVCQFPNHNVETLKNGPWADLLGLLGCNGEEIMMQLLFDCGIFAAINARKGVYYQLSGLPLSNLEPLDDKGDGSATAQKPTPVTDPSKPKKNEGKQKLDNSRGPNSIVFLRRRILYGRTESKKGISYGLGQTHVLNRFTALDSTAQTVHVMKYIFPRQFHLQNVFIPDPDTGNTPYDFKSGTFREKEISQLEHQRHLRRRQAENEGDADADADADAESESIKVPKRLRGTTEMIRKIRNRNAQCCYGELLGHYCPSEQTGPSRLGALASTQKSELAPLSSESNLVTQLQRPDRASCAETEPHRATGASCETGTPKARSLTDYATPPSAVSAFCRAVFQKLIPRQLLGIGVDGASNFKLVLRLVDRFIKLRRFESLSLHEVCKGVKVTSIPWLVPPQVQTSRSETRSKIALSDLRKRTELLHEFLFWVFDSLLIPLIRSQFYVTESQTHRNRLFYFRHDVWQQLTEQPFGDLKAAMFEELEPERVERVLARRSLGYGALRLLPKSTGIRPILNLRKRALKKSLWGKGRVFLAPSINSSITPIYSMLMYERQQAPAKLGSTMMSVGDMHHRLKTFKEQLSNQSISVPKPGQSKPGKFKLPPLYFVKVDIQACFDTIPQKKLLNLISELVSEDSYRMSKHVELQPPIPNMQTSKPTRRFVSRAAPAKKPQNLPDFIISGPLQQKANTVFVDSIAQKDQDTDSLLDLLDEHVRSNLVKMGKKYFRQKNGIPQGSVLSSILCNYFYAELERSVLTFIDPKVSLLLRLVDDFLLITPNRSVAMQFLQAMINGQPTYGVRVNASKSMTNFSAIINNTVLPRLEGPLFPYCGSLISTQTLELHRDQDRLLDGELAASALSNTLTVDATHSPGLTFHRKVLSSFRLQLHSMYIDDGHNSRSVVLSNLYASFVTTAMKMYHYMKSLGRAHPSAAIITRTITDLVLQTAGAIQARRADRNNSFSCFVQANQLRFLAARAFGFVLRRKQTRYAAVLGWLEALARQARPTSDSEVVRMTQVVRKGNRLFEEWRF